MSEEEYILEESEDSVESLVGDEKELMDDIQSLSKKFMERGIPCFLCAKFPSLENPTAAWHFGSDNQEALQMFAKDMAPLMLYMTSQMTGTTIVATNPDNNKIVYQISPSGNE